MRTPKLTLILGAAMLALFLGSCEIHQHNHYPTPPTLGDLEVRVTNPAGYPVAGVEVTLYFTDIDAVNHAYPLATCLTDAYGVAFFPELTGPAEYFVRAQTPYSYSLGTVFIDNEGLYVIDMEVL